MRCSAFAGGILAAVLVTAAAGTAQAQQASFDTDVVGQVPKGWTAGQTGRGSAKWAVVADETAPSKPHVLRQNGVAGYPVALLDAAAVKDGFVEVKFKAISGKEDRAAGIVWRAKDTNNYYVVRANALEDNVVLYKTVGGQRISLTTTKGDAYGVKAPVPPNVWHTIRVDFQGPRFKVTYNGKPLFEVDDPTFADAGKVGVWTKADSVTLFDDIAFGAAP
jgi:Domain of Unknown Function (DUF1080)